MPLLPKGCAPRRVAAGEQIVIAQFGIPVARLVPAGDAGARVLGSERRRVTIAADFGSPLPAEVLKGFEG